MTTDNINEIDLVRSAVAKFTDPKTGLLPSAGRIGPGATKELLPAFDIGLTLKGTYDVDRTGEVVKAEVKL